MSLEVTRSSLLFTTNTIIAATTPMTIAMVRSNTTVAAIVITYWEMEDLNFLPKMLLIAAQSFILNAVTISTPASAAIGMRLMTPPRRNIERISTMEWNTLTRRVCPPDLIATEVLAIAAVAGTPPSSGIIMLPIP